LPPELMQHPSHQPSLVRQPFLLSGFLGDDAQVIGIAEPKFTNIYPKRGISVNLPQLCDVGLPGEKPGWGSTRSKSRSRNNCGISSQNLKSNPTFQAEPIPGMTHPSLPPHNDTPPHITASQLP
jgi:hypothetical protein